MFTMARVRLRLHVRRKWMSVHNTSTFVIRHDFPIISLLLFYIVINIIFTFKVVIIDFGRYILYYFT
jgi:hypothetical protein